jgi:biopolymer transport protein ExbD
MRRHTHTAEDDHGIDLAPMLDFVLNLLIFFIVTAVFVKQSGMMVNRPSGAAAEPAGQEAKSIPILISAEGQVWIDEREIDVRAVLPNVTRLHAVNPKAGVLVIADADAQTGVVAQVIDQVREAGVYNITFSTSS